MILALTLVFAEKTEGHVLKSGYLDTCHSSGESKGKEDRWVCACHRQTDSWTVKIFLS